MLKSVQQVLIQLCLWAVQVKLDVINIFHFIKKVNPFNKICSKNLSSLALARLRLRILGQVATSQQI